MQDFPCKLVFSIILFARATTNEVYVYVRRCARQALKSSCCRHLPCLHACRRRGGGVRLQPQRRHFDEQGGPSVRYYQQFVLRSHTFHASYLLQHYYIAATCRSEPLSTSRAKNVKPARSGCAPASAMIKIEKLNKFGLVDCGGDWLQDLWLYVH